MWYDLKKGVSRRLFLWQIRGIAKTPPMPVVDAPLSVVSMVGKADVLMYVLSMKVLYRKLGRGKLVAIITQDTPMSSRALLERHFPGIRFVILEGIDPSPCQRGGTWERLVYIVRQSAQEYVIQADCDTLVVGDDIDEVLRCVEANLSFNYADNHWGIKPLPEIAAEARATASNYVGIVLERCFGDWPDAAGLKYVRGSSGFAGFAKGSTSMQELEQFHERMKHSLGARWQEWGTEQSASNFVVANAPGAVTLPFPDYATYPSSSPAERTKLLHFIGSSRFRKHYFARKGREAIAELICSRP